MQDEHNMQVADKQEVSDEGHALQERKLEFHDEKHLHKAPKAFTTDKKDDAEETIRWDTVPLDSYQWNVLPANVHTKASLLITLVHKYAKVTDAQEFQHQSRPVAGSNIFDIVYFAVNPSRSHKTSRPPIGWNEFLYFLSINKSIPRSILNKFTQVEVEDLEKTRIKKQKLSVPTPPFFASLFDKQ